MSERSAFSTKNLQSFTFQLSIYIQKFEIHNRRRFNLRQKKLDFFLWLSLLLFEELILHFGFLTKQLSSRKYSLQTSSLALSKCVLNTQNPCVIFTDAFLSFESVSLVLLSLSFNCAQVQILGTEFPLISEKFSWNSPVLAPYNIWSFGEPESSMIHQLEYLEQFGTIRTSKESFLKKIGQYSPDVFFGECWPHPTQEYSECSPISISWS